MAHDLRLTAFWILHFVLLGLFGLELVLVLTLWLRSSVPGLPANASPWCTLGTAIGFLLTFIALGGFLADYTTTAGVFAPDPTVLPLEQCPLVLYEVWRPQWGFLSYLSALALGAFKLSPSVWEVFRNLYLVDEGKIVLRSFPQPVTYHDPCVLGRTSGIYGAPRRIIEAIPGIQFPEMADNRGLSLRCGGGDAEMANPELTASVGKRRIQQVQETGAKVVISAFQQCDRKLVEAVRKNHIRIRAMDVAQVV